MPHEFDVEGAGGYTPEGKSKGGAYNPSDYGLPIWRDEDHLPSEKEEASVPNTEQTAEVSHSMSVEQAKHKLCLWAQEQIGYHEGSGNHNKYADNHDLQKMYGWHPQNQPWCDVFVDVGFIECFGLNAACAMTYQPIGAGSALCKQSAQYYKDNGAFFKTPELGDQVFFFASGDINHTGIVVRVYGGSVVCVEGNSSDQVAERVYSIGDSSRIAGYGRPDWSVVCDDHIADTGNMADNSVSTPSKQRFYELRLPYLQNGDNGKTVEAVQFQLMGQCYNVGPDGADGDFGGNTEEAVKEFQLNVHLTPDGVVGPYTAAKLFGGEVVTAKEADEPTVNEPKASSFWDGLIDKIRGKETNNEHK